MSISVLRQVTAIQTMEGAKLRQMWKEYFEGDPPTNNKGFLAKRLAYRIQELALGVLPVPVEERLGSLADGNKDPVKPKAEPDQGKNRPIPGTCLIREWKGVEHCCNVLEDGFEYQGRKFRSLSAVANAITGTRWNGHVFWGMRRQGEKV
ncbi:MAG: DUF2924 domain-containing protein [Magnetococcus sp. DMHC-1]